MTAFPSSVLFFFFFLKKTILSLEDLKMLLKLAGESEDVANKTKN